MKWLVVLAAVLGVVVAVRSTGLVVVKVVLWLDSGSCCPAELVRCGLFVAFLSPHGTSSESHGPQLLFSPVTFFERLFLLNAQGPGGAAPSDPYAQPSQEPIGAASIGEPAPAQTKKITKAAQQLRNFGN
jgi:hypothetical protein